MLEYYKNLKMAHTEYKYSYFRIFQFFFMQKILRLNSNIPWPVHYTSMVLVPQKIERQTPTTNLGSMPGSYIQAINGIIVGRNTFVGPAVKIISADHNLYNFSIHNSGKPIKIGNNCWIGANTVILPEVELGDHTIVAAGAVVSKSFPLGDCIIGGVPAKLIRKIDKYGSSQH